MTKTYTEEQIREAVNSMTFEQIQTLLVALADRARRYDVAGSRSSGDHRPGNSYSTHVEWDREQKKHATLIVCDRCSKEWFFVGSGGTVDRIFNIMVHHRTECSHSDMLNGPP